MIGRLRGQVDAIGTETALIDVNGVGYVVHCSARTLGALSSGEEATVHVETVMREDMLRLYGFSTAVEVEWFRLLQTVQGVGAKVALAILGTLSGAEIAAALAAKDHKPFVRAPGVGPRVGQRLVAELDGKVPAGLAVSAVEAMAKPGEPESVAEAASALSNLGYARNDALSAVRKILEEHGDGTPVPTIIRHALKSLSRR